VKLSLIITTYNRPDALERVLLALNLQFFRDFEVIVADDGSSDATKHLLADMKPRLFFPVEHVWQPDEGFRAAMVRNRAVAACTGGYLVFLDGDCIPFPDFLAGHRHLAEKRRVVTGNRLLLSKEFTRQVLEQRLTVETFSLLKWLEVRSRGGCNRLYPLLKLPDGGFRQRHARRWQGVRTCNLGVSREDFLAVNGFDERYTGWGYEDSDLMIRLLKSGVLRKDGRFHLAVAHLWHPEHDRSRERDNYAQLIAANKGGAWAASGVEKYLEKS
jgi:glycosyltransferase involved in cell wall biosynthesis